MPPAVPRRHSVRTGERLQSKNQRGHKVSNAIQPQPRAPRPDEVTAASYLLFTAAACLVVAGVSQFALTDVVRDPSSTTEQSDPTVYAALVVLALPWIVVAAGLTTLGIFNGKGVVVSRILTWVFGGLTLCCCGLGSGAATFESIAISHERNNPAWPNPTDSTEVARAAIPQWWHPLIAGTLVLVVISVGAALILLARPASRQFFARRGRT